MPDLTVARFIRNIIIYCSDYVNMTMMLDKFYKHQYNEVNDI